MKTNISKLLFIAVLSLVLFGCGKDIEIGQKYPFTVSVMPYADVIGIGETVEFRLQIEQEGSYSETEYYIRYFQSKGSGTLVLDNGKTLVANDRMPLRSESFRLYYTSLGSDQHVFDVIVEDNFGQEVSLSFTLSNDNGTSELKPFAANCLPYQTKVEINKQVEIKFEINREGYYQSEDYKIRYFVTSGAGSIEMENTVLLANKRYNVPENNFSVFFETSTPARNVIDIYIEDAHGQTEKITLNIESENVYKELFTVTYLPVPKRVKIEETVEIRFKIARNVDYDKAIYQVRYFQPDGKGTVCFDDGRLMAFNDLYAIVNKEFRMYYTSQSEEQSVLDFVFVDNAGQEFPVSFSFNNDNRDEE